MSATLYIYLMGLVALVPSNDGKHLTILLQEARREDHHHVHFPVLIYDAKNVVSVWRDEGPQIESALCLQDPPKGFFLNGVDIEIEAVMVGALSFLKGTHDSSWVHPWIGTVPESQMEAKDSFWIPKMEQVVPGSEVVAERHLSDGVSACDIAARLRLEHGEVSTFGLASFQAMVYSLSFKKPGILPVLRGVKGALADVVRIEVKLNGANVKIFTKEFQGARRERLSLAPKDGVIEILIGNLTPLMKPKKQPAAHFALYQKLSDNPQENVRIPHFGVWRKVPEVKVEPYMPNVIRSVGKDPAKLLGAGVYKCADGGEAGTDRPMCTTVVMREPDL